MTIVTAKAAGVPRVIACTPPIRGVIPPATVAAAYYAGADEIWILGGVQAIASMAIGTETVAKVDFIAGPGNPFVAEAKRQLFGEIGIDLPAGPTEVLIVADEKADPATVATDILSQAEHGPDTPSVVITNSQKVGEETLAEINRQLQILPTADIAGVSWANLGEIIVVDSLDEAYKLADVYASEHVQILTENPREALDKMSNYGALFLGEQTCVSYGDKVRSPQRPHAFVYMYSQNNSVSVPTTSCPPRAQHDSPEDFGWGNTSRLVLTNTLLRPRRVVSWVCSVAVLLAPRTLRVMPGQAT